MSFCALCLEATTRPGFVYLGENLNQRLLLHSAPGRVEQQTDVDVGALPDPVLVPRNRGR